MNNFVLNELVYTNFKINVRLEEILSLVNFYLKHVWNVVTV